VQLMFAASLAIFLQLDAAGIVTPVLLRYIVALITLRTSQSDVRSYRSFCHDNPQRPAGFSGPLFVAMGQPARSILSYFNPRFA